MIPYRQLEILQVLNANPSGLTTEKLMNQCRAKPGSEIPDDSGVMSKLLYAMRHKGTPTIERIEHSGGARFRITAAGKQVLAENDPNLKPKTFAEQTAEQAAEQAAEQTAEQSIDTKELFDQLKNGFQDLTTTFNDQLENYFSALLATQFAIKPPHIPDLQQKIELLEQLDNVMTTLKLPQSTELIQAIIHDLETIGG